MFFLFISLPPLLLFPSINYAKDITLIWNANIEPDLKGYYLYFKTGSSGPPYEVRIDVGNITTHTLVEIDEEENYFFVVTAYDMSGLESDYSNEVSTKCSHYYKDVDGDSYGLSNDWKCLIISEGTYSALKGDDCDDNDRETYPEAIEKCDQKDNDCDGLIDENFNLNTDPWNCGACGYNCNFAKALAQCQAGVCIMGSCDDGYYNLNADPIDGCEYACTISNEGVELIDNLDNNCDGIIDNYPQIYITSLPPLQATVGEPYFYIITGNAPDLNWHLLQSFSNLTLESLYSESFESSCAKIQWLPDSPGKWGVSVLADRDDFSFSEEQNWLIEVNEGAFLEGRLGYYDQLTGNFMPLTYDCDFNNLLPIRIDLYSRDDGTLVASTDYHSSSKKHILFSSPGTGNYQVDGPLAEGAYTMVALDQDPTDDWCYLNNSLALDGSFIPNSQDIHLTEGINNISLFMNRTEQKHTKILGLVMKTPPEVTGPISLILTGLDFQGSYIKQKALFPAEDLTFYQFFVSDGEYTLLGQAKGYKGSSASFMINNHEKNFPQTINYDLPLQRADPSVSIIRENVITHLPSPKTGLTIRLHFQYNNPKGDPSGWDEAKADLSLRLFCPKDDLNADGLPDNPENPTGSILPTSVVNNSHVFPVQYLTTTLELGDLEQQPTQVMTIFDDSYMIGLFGRFTVQGKKYTFIRKLAISKSTSLEADLLSETIERIKPSELTTKTNIPLMVPLTIGQKIYPVHTKFNAANLDPTLFYRIDCQNNLPAEVSFDEEMTLSVRYSKISDDPNILVMDISLSDSQGWPVEYTPFNSYDLNSLQTDSPMVFYLPLHSDLQSLTTNSGLSFSDLTDKVAKDIDDFTFNETIWQAQSGKYGIYREIPGEAVQLFVPDQTKGEKIQVTSSPEGILLALITATNFSKWYCAPADGQNGSDDHQTDNDEDDDADEYDCSPTNNGVEICDQIDNDCDEAIDEEVIDDTPPILTCPVDLSLEYADFIDKILDLGQPGYFDLCDEYPIITNNAPMTFTVGTTTVLWQATDQAGNTSSCRQLVTILPPSPPLIDFSGKPSKGFIPHTVTFTAVNNGGPVSNWSWEFGDGETSSEQNPLHTYQSPGRFTVSLTAFGPFDSHQKTKTGYIIVTSPLGADLTGQWLELSDKISLCRGKFQVTNKGNKKGDSKFNLVFYSSEDGKTPHIYLRDKTIYSELEAGQSTTFSFWIFSRELEEDKYLLTYIDYGNLIPETNEINNTIITEIK